MRKMAHWMISLLPLMLFNCSDQPDSDKGAVPGSAAVRELQSVESPVPGPEIQSAVSSGDLAGVAKMFLKLVSGGDFNHAVTAFSPSLKKKMPPAQLKNWWEQENREMGKFQSRGAVGIASENGRSVIYIGCIFEKGIRDLRIAFNSDSQIDDLSLVPSGVFHELPPEIHEIVEPASQPEK
ncbi:MAG: DUF3887 domain-containing protein [bacterium]